MKHKKTVHIMLLVIRIILGIIFFAHGMQKFNMGMDAVTQMFDGVGIPLAGFFAWIVTLLETFGGVALIVGVGVRIVSLLLAVVMFVGVIVKWQFGLISVGNGAGFELDLALIAALLPLLVYGAGKFSLLAFRKSEIQDPTEMPRQMI